MFRTNIPYADYAAACTYGCSHAGDGCDHCYAERLACGRLRRLSSYRSVTTTHGWTGRIRWNPDALLPAITLARPSRIFVCHMSDLFHGGVPFPVVDEIFRTIRACPRHAFLILTKRTECMRLYAERVGGWPPNAWAGFSAWDQESFDRGWNNVAQIPAAVRWCSLEPLLGPVDVASAMPDPYGLRGPAISWIVAGGETGPGARACNVRWIVNLWGKCLHATPFFFKQWGTAQKTLTNPAVRMIQCVARTREFPDANCGT